MRMQNIFIKGMLLLCVAGLAGCVIVNVGGCGGKESFSRTIELSSPMEAGALLKIRTTNGSVTAQGAETQMCAVIAKITGRAKTKERAQELAEQTQIQLQPSGSGLETVIVAPKKDKKESICVGFEVTMPNMSSLDAASTNGNISADGLTGDVTAHTTNGNVKLNQVLAQSIKAQSTNGSIAFHQVTGSLNAHTTNGSVRVDFAPQADAAANVNVNTTNGSISMTLPKDCSAKVNASTANGRVKTDVPVTASGHVAKNRLNGTIGGGDGKLTLRTVNGSIDIH